MSESRCTCCGRLSVVGSVNGTLPSLEVLKPYADLILRWCRAFDEITPAEEAGHYGAVDMADFMVLNMVGVKPDTRKYSIPAGKPAGKRKRAA